MRKAAVGFRFHGLGDELKVSSQEDLNKRREDKEYESKALEKARKRRWWHRHKERLNAERRAAARSIEGRYKAAKAKALEKGEEWSFTPEEWERKWIDAGWVLIPGSITPGNPHGQIVPAFAIRGAHRYHNTCMERISLNKGWNTENTRIVFRGEELKPGCRWYREGPSMD